MIKVNAANLESEIRDTLVNWEIKKGSVKRMTAPEGATYTGEASREFSTITYKGYRYEIPYTYEMPLYSGGGIYDASKPLHEGKVNEIPYNISKDFRRLVMKFFYDRGFKNYWYWDKDVDSSNGKLTHIVNKLIECDIRYPINLEKILPVSSFGTILFIYKGNLSICPIWNYDGGLLHASLIINTNGEVIRCWYNCLGESHKYDNLSTILPIVNSIIDQKNEFMKYYNYLGGDILRKKFLPTDGYSTMKVDGIKVNTSKDPADKFDIMKVNCIKVNTSKDSDTVDTEVMTKFIDAISKMNIG